MWTNSQNKSLKFQRMKMFFLSFYRKFDFLQPFIIQLDVHKCAYLCSEKRLLVKPLINYIVANKKIYMYVTCTQSNMCRRSQNICIITCANTMHKMYVVYCLDIYVARKCIEFRHLTSHPPWPLFKINYIEYIR